jgi:hypothetical protein
MVQEEKGEFQDHMTLGELTRYLRISESAMKRLATRHPPARRSARGWGLWSPEQQTELLRERLS